MRLDELPRSDKVEDRRGDGPGGFPMGRAGVPPLQSVARVAWAIIGKPRFVPIPAERASGLCGIRTLSTRDINPLPFRDSSSASLTIIRALRDREV